VSLTGEFSQEREAGAGRVHEHEAARQRAQQVAPLARAQVGTDEIEFGFFTVERRAVADEEHQQLIVLRHPLPQRGERGADIFAGGRLDAAIGLP